jgi:hypothetical protein
MMRVLLAGEGKTELGEWAKEPPYREQPGQKGVLVALIERVTDRAFTIVNGLPWAKIRKYRSGEHASPEQRNVLGLALQARSERCDAVVFSRDRDGSVERQRDLDEGVRRAREIFADLKLVGGITIENIEGWILVLLKVPGESLSSKRTKPELEARFGIVSLQAKVDVVASALLDNVLPGSLTEWLGRARNAFALEESHDGP